MGMETRPESQLAMNDGTPSSSPEHVPTLGFIGAGAVAHALAPALAQAGYPVVSIFSRSEASAATLAARIPRCAVATSAEAITAAARVIFLTVPDDVIAPLAASLPWQPGSAAIHCSGATPLTVLAAARARGVLVGALHPLLSISRAAALEDRPGRFDGCTFAVNADPTLLPLLTTMVARLGARPLPLADEARIPYHLAAVIVSNYTVALLQTAAKLWSTFQASRDAALAGLVPLLRSVVDNTARQGIPGALTGPIARGDLGTLQAHLAYLRSPVTRDRFPQLADIDQIYRRLGLLTISVALEKGSIDEQQADAIAALLSAASNE